MVVGIDKFRSYFEDYQDHYAWLGIGWLLHAGFDFAYHEAGYPIGLPGAI